LNYATSFYGAWESRRKQRHIPYGVRGLKPPDFFEMLKMAANKLLSTQTAIHDKQKFLAEDKPNFNIYKSDIETEI
jgi:hypothetical protein